ncbi:helix-turn-helix domain-containing protein [Cytobacillus purgationiresistens]|uniref:DNA-binding Lrp family transcriptional regulator n=1 Tax=Cytobacillus purgationiresistens TaxID=863449 RepID=A0ABU0AHG4_9BACI|nr:helix-turn-helix domain-containing protein [Cytobacillus purgationiresistens]MDQ0270701.1 DNA-binding Lrp family transcriptional regulator [Cytobacillus purgationiresistens]
MHYLSDYQTFNTTQQLNDAVDTHIKRNAFELNDTDRLTLSTIARYAVKFAGAAHLKAATLAEIIGKSEKTARRIVNKLGELGIVEKVATLRKINGGKGANILRILPVNELRFTRNDQSSVSNRVDSAEPTESNAKLAKNENEPLDSINLKNNTYLDTSVPSQALKDSLPNDVYNAMERYFIAEEIYKYYGILLRAKRSINSEVVIEDNPEPFVTAFHNAILKTKQQKIRKLDDYLYRAWQNATTRIVRQRTVNESGVFYDWLNG